MSVRTEVAMGTLVSIEVVSMEVVPDALDRAFGWFYQIEAVARALTPVSELMRLTCRIGAACPASEILFQSVNFALTVAEETDGAFDPTVGHRHGADGFNRIIARAKPFTRRRPL